MKRICLAWMLVLAIGCGGGAGGDVDAGPDATPDADTPDGGASLLPQLVAHAQQCGLLGPGIGPDITADYDPTPFGRCQLQCLLSSCANISDELCGTSEGDDCEVICTEALAHTCGNGDIIPGDYVCDDDFDCPDGSDEENCGDYFYMCDDGLVLEASEECDGFEDCFAGEDEANCPVFTCADGEQQIEMGYLCDGGIPDCTDGSDESNCAALMCGG